MNKVVNSFLLPRETLNSTSERRNRPNLLLLFFVSLPWGRSLAGRCLRLQLFVGPRHPRTGADGLTLSLSEVMDNRQHHASCRLALVLPGTTEWKVNTNLGISSVSSVQHKANTAILCIWSEILFGDF